MYREMKELSLHWWSDVVWCE